MRTELELTEIIEKYLKNELSATEKAEFEKRLSTDFKLKQEVKLQQDIMNGIERAVIKQKIQKAYKKYINRRNFLKWGGIGAGIILVSSVILFFISRHHTSEGFTQNLPELNEQGTKQWSDADRYLPAQVFVINTSQDTVIQTKGGMVLAVPANCFLDDEGNPVSGSIELEVKEALDPASIMKAGLSTRAGGRLLESAGMFYLNGRKNGKSLKINPHNGIYVHVPADTIKGGMQAFEGKRMPDGTIDWVNPMPLAHNLVPVNIHTLNFYPPLYLDSLAKWGYDIKNKKFMDSLYYSFASLFGIQNNTDTITHHDITFQLKDSAPCGINPAKIKAIWCDEFQNTIISTKEFEARMPYIHKTGNTAILDLYVNNLDKSLSYIDSLAAEQLSGNMKAVFLSFAERGDGKITIKSPLFEKLKAFYENKSRLFAEAVAKAQHDFSEEQNKLDAVAQNKKDTDHRRARLMIGDEYKANLKAACRQVGDPDSIGVVDKNGYAILCTGTGWKNIDAYVSEATETRTTLNYTSPVNGKTAIIKYLPFSIFINDYQKYDNVFVYLLPDRLNSFMRLIDTNGKFNEKLDEIFSYKMECIAYKGNQAFYYSMDSVQPKDYSGINLQAISINDLNKKLGEIGNRKQEDAMAKEADYMQYEILDKQRRKKNEEMADFRNKVEKLIFPCYYEEQQAQMQPQKCDSSIIASPHRRYL